jgi:pimeloyl-ACP methyl ester carboxylesterase
MAAQAQTQPQTAPHLTPPSARKLTIKYGSNPAASKTFVHDGIKFYYEVYGTGEPVLMVHGNGGSIASLAAQIDYFRKHYMVIAMDSRDQGKSGDSQDKTTYEKMTDDLSALLDHLKVAPVNVVGWSDGGIEALLLGVRHPEQVKKIASMAANLDPSESAIYPEVLDWVRDELAAVTPEQKTTPEGRRELRLRQMLLEEPHIDPQDLENIAAPTLILSGDHDLIRDEHTLEIYHHVPFSELCIFPNSTHAVPFDDPELFNSTVERFFRTPYEKKDRIKDVLKSFEKMRSAAQ